MAVKRRMPAACGGVGQRPGEHGAEPLALVGVGHGDGEVGHVAAGLEAHAARHPRASRAGSRHGHGGQGEVVALVDVR